MSVKCVSASVRMRGPLRSKVRSGSKTEIDGSSSNAHRDPMKAHCLAVALLLLGAAPVAAQSVSNAEAERMIAEPQASHIEANVPDESRFSRLLERDLNAYFETKGVRNPGSRFELLRQGPTQSGVAYPKFYLWVRVSSGPNHVAAGAVRVAAVQGEGFEVTDFLTAEEIREAPNRVGSIFPAPLVGAIYERAGIGASASRGPPWVESGQF